MAPFLVALVVISLVVALGLHERRRDARRVAAVGAAAERLGLGFEPSARHAYETRWAGVPPFADWGGPLAFGALVEAPDLAIFEYRRTGGGAGAGVRYTFAARRAAPPPFVLRPRPAHSVLPRSPGPLVDPLDRLLASDEARARWAALAPVDLPPPLAAHYELRADPRASGPAGAVAATFGDEQGWTVHAQGDWVFVGRVELLRAERLGEQVAAYRRVLDGLEAGMR
jgi:hypothetical protein